MIVSIGHTVCDNVNLMLTLQKDQCDINVNVWDDKVYIRISTYVTKSVTYMSISQKCQCDKKNENILKM